MSKGFYRAFEERYRGSRELIKERLTAYLPFVAPLLKVSPAAAAIDLGCGRGEWLEVLTGVGFKPMGVDLDSGMLAACHELDLIVELDDAISYLSRLSDNSQVVVSAFHLVEHISFEQLQAVVAEAIRVLKPGGLLIMETPNPENIIVSTRNFYLDPTHERPIPPMLLSFVAEYAGFSRVKTLRLQEPKELIKKEDISLQDVFSGASPDYAIIAQKHASDDVLTLTNEAFSRDYGLSLENLLSRWDSRFGRLEAKTEQAQATLIAMQQSSSWRLTAPLRSANKFAKKLLSRWSI
jgi:SAM-dependent methyltransferase